MKTSAIVMRIVRHSDSTVVAHLFTRECGMLTFAVRRPTGGRVRGASAALLQPLTQLNIECQHDASRMQTLHNAELAVTYTSLPFEPHKAAIAMFLAEVLWHALRHEQASVTLYDFVALSLQWLDSAETDYANFHVLFLLQLTRHLGYDPSLLPEAEHLDIHTLMRHNYRTMRLLPLNGAQRSHFLDCLIDFYRNNIPSFPDINSIKVLKECI